MKKICRIIFFNFFIIFSVILFLIVFYSYKIPNIYKIFIGQNIPFNFYGVKFSKINEEMPNLKNKSKKFIENEFYNAKLFNLIPIKNVVVKKYSKMYVVPCGVPFGVKFLTDGVMIVDTQEVCSLKGKKNPSKEAGLKKGDIIEFVNGKKVNSNDDLKKVVYNSKGETISLKYNRNFRQCETKLTPIFSSKENKWLTGLWVRDSSAGIGTVTFCTEEGIFGGLGHAVCDIDTGEKMPLGSGEIVEATINDVKQGTSGNPGELCGVFSKKTPIGNVKINSECGLYGKFYKPINPNKPVMIGFKQEAKIGRAYIYSTISGKEPKKYEIEIESINEASDYKNYVIKIVDEELLKATGGIVQGMSGSPIVQNEKLIGAVTHVFLNDPSRGYGVFAETMLEVSDEIND